uniref:Uncharacterized protein n=1 Tax=Anguilla anguilla TaxID=7936 RepID=A0A0E9XQ32_ANGAN
MQCPHERTIISWESCLVRCLHAFRYAPSPWRVCGLSAAPWRKEDNKSKNESSCSYRYERAVS